MAAPFVGQTGRLAEHDPRVRGGARLPVQLLSTWIASLATGTHTINIRADEAFTLRRAQFRANLSTGTAVVDILKSTDGSSYSSVLVGTQSLSDDATRVLEGLGSDATGEDRNFNTATDANRKKLRFEKGDYIRVTVVVATAAATDVYLGLKVDERQPF